jgi:hypothetical protein
LINRFIPQQTAGKQERLRAMLVQGNTKPVVVVDFVVVVVFFVVVVVFFVVDGLVILALSCLPKIQEPLETLA